jgi:ABC-type branched-subunit amino acid transport system ATPase component
MSKYRRSDRLIILNQGKIIADGIPDTIIRNPNLMESDGI